MTIKKITLSGTPQEIGFQHGRLLAEQIHHNIDFYRSLFIKTVGDQSQILEAAKKFKQSIQNYNPSFVVEIDQIAQGSNVSEPLWLYAMNARTELSMLNGHTECTAVVCPEDGFLAQTWDWSEELEENFALMEIIFPDGHKILQLSEAGIIGKIGLNNRGLGVTLNYLFDDHVDFATIPIHILLRQVLESQSLDQAKDAVLRSGIGKASNLIIACSKKAVNIEFAGDLIHYHDIDARGYVHTNHFLHAKPPVFRVEDSFINSNTRRDTALKKLETSSAYDLQRLKELLSDQINGKNAILAEFKPDPLEMLGNEGTLATIIMDLDSHMMLVREGNPSNFDFSVNAFSEHRLS